MSKKGKNSKEANKNPKIVDQQKEPCLRALQKKVRNINKRLNEIADLQKRNDLKPEQLQKIERKQAVLDERDKFTEFINIYQELVAENKKSYQQWKLGEVREIAEALVAHEYGFNSENSSIRDLATIIQNPSSNDLTLNERLSEVSEALLKVAESTKLKEKVKKYNEENSDKTQGNKEENENESEGNLPLITKQTLSEMEHKKENKAEPLQEVIPEQQEHKEESSANNLPAAEKTEEPEQPKDTTPQQTEEKVETKVEEPKENTQEAPQEPANNEDKKRKPYQKGRRDNEGRRENGGRRNFNENRREGDAQQEGGQRRYRNDRPYNNNKKKYQEKNPQPAPQNDDDDSSSLEKTPEPREFKKEEVRELIEDGFIVVGKPKPKGHDQKQYHEHTHGRKNHHHHKNTNY